MRAAGSLAAAFQQLVEGQLATIRETLLLSQQTLAEVNAGLDTVEATAVDTSVAISRTGPLVEQLTLLASDTVPQNIESTPGGVARVVRAGQGSGLGLRALSQVQIEPTSWAFPSSWTWVWSIHRLLPWMSRWRKIEQSLGGLAASLRSQSGQLNAAREDVSVISQDVLAISEDLRSVNQRLREFDPLIDQYVAMVDELTLSLQEAQESVLASATTLKVGAIAVLIWMALIQAAPLYLGWELVSGRRPASWGHGPRVEGPCCQAAAYHKSMFGGERMTYDKIKVPSAGAKITLQDGQLHVPDNPIVAFIEGDGTGPDIWAASQPVFDAAVAKAYGGRRRIAWMEAFAGEKANEVYGKAIWLPEETVQVIDEYIVAIKGPLTTPVGGGIRSINVALRQRLDLYACVRPVQYFTGVPSPVKRPDLIDMIIFRENTEDIYAGIEFEDETEEVERFKALFEEAFPAQYAKIRFPGSSGIGIKPISAEGTARLVRAAISYAIQNGRQSVTLVHKGNIMKFTEGAFRNWGYQVAAEEFGGVPWEGGPWHKLPNASSSRTSLPTPSCSRS